MLSRVLFLIILQKYGRLECKGNKNDFFAWNKLISNAALSNNIEKQINKKNIRHKNSIIGTICGTKKNKRTYHFLETDLPTTDLSEQTTNNTLYNIKDNYTKKVLKKI